ncbi:MAG TPA: hypothetical protein VJ810_19245 [Blastocatellia bacterium]|nr:hypothetical protein [Blastocatellia bacterium]
MLSKSILGLIVSAIFLSLTINAQDQRPINIKIEDFPQAYQNKEPVKIIGLYLGTTMLQSGEDFQADKDWLRNLRVMVKNVSDQPIREIIFNLDTKTDGPDGEIKRFHIHYGPSYWFRLGPVTKGAEEPLAPGALATISRNTDDTKAYEWTRSQLASSRHFQISLDSVVFDDIDKGWYGTTYVMRSEKGWTRDPSKAHLNGGPPRAN